MENMKTHAGVEVLVSWWLKLKDELFKRNVWTVQSVLVSRKKIFLFIYLWNVTVLNVSVNSYYTYVAWNDERYNDMLVF